MRGEKVGHVYVLRKKFYSNIVWIFMHHTTLEKI